MRRLSGKRMILALGATFAVPLTVPALASAHVVVTPNQVQTGQRTLFSVSVPNEREVAVSGLRLTIPSGVTDAMPTVHAGWTITTKQDASHTITEIDWTGGTIPAGQRDDFTFKAQAPGKQGDLHWKAYQTYADGVVVAWDVTPTTSADKDDDSTSGPYSVTKVSADQPSPATSTTTKPSPVPLAVGLAALVLSIAALTQNRGKRPTGKITSKKA